MNTKNINWALQCHLAKWLMIMMCWGRGSYLRRNNNFKNIKVMQNRDKGIWVMDFHCLVGQRSVLWPHSFGGRLVDGELCTPALGWESTYHVLLTSLHLFIQLSRARPSPDFETNYTKARNA